MTEKELVQQRIEELYSAIIDTRDNKMFITGFMSGERLFDFHENHLKCWASQGIYNIVKFDIAYIKDNAVFLILEDGKEIERYKFIPIKKETVRYKSETTKSGQGTKIYTIRRCEYTGLLNYKDMDRSILFKTEDELNEFMTETYPDNKANIGEQVSLL